MHISSPTPNTSVIIPVYNVEKYLARCLDSVLAQTFTDFEIICVNDGSTDNSPAILADYQTRSPIKLKIINQANQGLSGARNSGLKVAEGKYVCFLDSDDFIHPQLLEITTYFADKYSADLVSFNADEQYRKDSRTDIPEFKVYNNPDRIPFRQTNNPLLFIKSRNRRVRVHITAWSKLYRRELLQGLTFEPRLLFEDVPYTLRIFRNYPKTIILGEALYYYVNNDTSITNTKYTIKSVQDHTIGFKIIDNVYKTAPAREINFIAKRVLFGKLKHQYKRIMSTQKDNPADISSLKTAFLEQLDFLNTNGWFQFPGFRVPENPYWYYKIKSIIETRTVS